MRTLTWELGISLVMSGVVIGFVAGIVIGESSAYSKWESQMVNRGAAYYHPKTAEWTWTGKFEMEFPLPEKGLDK